MSAERDRERKIERHFKSPQNIEGELIVEGVYNAWIDCLTATGGYPITRSEILDEVHRGVKDAVLEFLQEQPLDFLREGVAKAAQKRLAEES